MDVLYDVPGHLLWRSQARVTAAVSDSLPGRSDIHAYAALLALGVEEPQSQQGLARLTGVSGTTMTAVAETLQADGLVERVRNPGDRRSYALTRTPAGRSALRRWASQVRRLEARLTSALSDAQVSRLQQLLTVLVGDQLDVRTPPPCGRAPASCSPGPTSGCTASSSPPSARSTSSPGTTARCAP